MARFILERTLSLLLTLAAVLLNQPALPAPLVIQADTVVGHRSPEDVTPAERPRGSGEIWDDEFERFRKFDSNGDVGGSLITNNSHCPVCDLHIRAYAPGDTIDTNAS